MEHAHPITLDIKVILTCLLLIRRGRGWEFGCEYKRKKEAFR